MWFDFCFFRFWSNCFGFHPSVAFNFCLDSYSNYSYLLYVSIFWPFFFMKGWSVEMKDKSGILMDGKERLKDRKDRKLRIVIFSIYFLNMNIIWIIDWWLK